MKKNIRLIFALAGMLFSCHEEVVLEEVEEDNEEMIAEKIDLSPACTYTVDGTVYECNRLTGWGNGSYPVNPEEGKAFEEYDTLFFRTMATMSKSLDAELKINIGKKFAVQQMVPGINRYYRLSTKDREAFVVERSYPFSLDYWRYNTQDGVALEIMAIIDGKREILTTYSTAARSYPTAVTAESQEKSYFVVTKIHHRPNGNLIVEAEFEALFFGREVLDPTETIKKVKGTARFPVNWVD